MEDRRLRLTHALLGLGLAALTGCNQAKVRECNALNEQINKGVARVDALEKERLSRPDGGHRQTSEAMKKTARLYEELAQSIAGVELKQKELKALSQDYVFNLRSAGAAADGLAAALDRDRRDEAVSFDQTYAKHIESQKKTIEKINAFCSQ